MEKCIQQEFLEISLQTEGHSVSTTDLIAYLSNADKLIMSINQTQNVAYTIGFDQVEIEVMALKEGSFKIPLCIKKITNNPTFASIAGAVIGGIIVHLLTNNPVSQTIQYGEDTIVLEGTKFLQNKKTLSAVGTIARLTVEDEKINALSVTYERTDGEKEQVSINKQTLSQVIYNEQEEDSISNIVTNVTLEIVSPVFVDKPASWKVCYDNKVFTAKMTDEDFLETMNLQRISFAKDDKIVADMEIVAKTTEKGIRLTHYIRKVHNYPKYTRITKQEQLDLFNSVEE